MELPRSKAWNRLCGRQVGGHGWLLFVVSRVSPLVVLFNGWGSWHDGFCRAFVHSDWRVSVSRREVPKSSSSCFTSTAVPSRADSHRSCLDRVGYSFFPPHRASSSVANCFALPKACKEKINIFDCVAKSAEQRTPLATFISLHRSNCASKPS